MLDPNIQPSLEVSAELFVHFVESAYEGLPGFVVEENEHDFFGTATRKYVAGLLERNSTIKVLTMREPQPLEDLYVRINILQDKITAQHGIFVERANRVHSFAHPSFQEYFTAKYIVDNARKGMLETLVNEHLYDDRWKEVFLLVSGMLASTDDLLLLMQSKNDKLLQMATLNALLDAAEQALLEEGEMMNELKEKRNLESKQLTIIRKTVAICIAVKYRNPFAIAIAEAVSSKLNPKSRTYIAGYYIRRMLAFDLDRNLLLGGLSIFNIASDIASIFNLDFDRLEAFAKENKITRETAEEVINYLKGNALIINLSAI